MKENLIKFIKNFEKEHYVGAYNMYGYIMREIDMRGV